MRGLSDLALRIAMSAIVIGAIATVQMPSAAADPTMNSTFPAGQCGDPNDTKDSLWRAVMDPSVTPANPKPNLKVVWTNNSRDLGYAIHNGQQGGATYDFLLTPTIRELGIECANLLRDDAPLYFRDAYSELGFLPAGTDWALGINSIKRGQNQLHIHITRLADAARKDIDTAINHNQIATDEKYWKDSEIVVKGHSFRAWTVGTMNHNFFKHLHDHFVVPMCASMANEALLFSPNRSTGQFIVLASDETTGMNPPGVPNIELLLNKG